MQTGLIHGTGMSYLGGEIRIVSPVLAGDTIRVTVTISDKRETKKPDRGIVTLHAYRHQPAWRRGAGGAGQAHDQAGAREGVMRVLGRGGPRAAPRRPADVIRAVEGAFREHAAGRARTLPRAVLPMRGDGLFLAMVGSLPRLGARSAPSSSTVAWRQTAGAVFPRSTPLYLLTDPETGVPLALMEAGFLTAIRTGAASALAARYLARRDSKVVACFGAGVQARYQLLCLRSGVPHRARHAWWDARPRAPAPSPPQMRARARAFPWRSTRDRRAAVAEADLVTCATTSPDPRLRWPGRPARHPRGRGGRLPAATTRELDTALVRRASVVVVDTYEGAWEEAGDSSFPSRPAPSRAAMSGPSWRAGRRPEARAADPRDGDHPLQVRRLRPRRCGHRASGLSSSREAANVGTRGGALSDCRAHRPDQRLAGRGPQAPGRVGGGHGAAASPATPIATSSTTAAPTARSASSPMELIRTLQAEGHPIAPGQHRREPHRGGTRLETRSAPGAACSSASTVLVEVTRYTSPCGNIRAVVPRGRLRARLPEAPPGREPRLRARAPDGAIRRGDPVRLLP